MNTPRNINRCLTIALLGIPAAGQIIGCAAPKEPDEWTIYHPLPSRDENVQSAQSLVKDAQAAERRGDYARAVEIYTQLQSFPDYARPDHLDQRIHDVQIKGTRGA